MLALILGKCIYLIPFIIFYNKCHAQQSYREQSTIDMFGNKNPIFNYMPNPGHVDVDRLEQIQKYTDLREEEGIF